jgi:hypothetical protein
VQSIAQESEVQLVDSAPEGRLKPGKEEVEEPIEAKTETIEDPEWAGELNFELPEEMSEEDAAQLACIEAMAEEVFGQFSEEFKSQVVAVAFNKYKEGDVTISEKIKEADLLDEMISGVKEFFGISEAHAAMPFVSLKAEQAE